MLHELRYAILPAALRYHYIYFIVSTFVLKYLFLLNLKVASLKTSAIYQLKSRQNQSSRIYYVLEIRRNRLLDIF